MVKNDPTGCSRFGEFFLGFGAQDGVLGARVSFGTQSYVYIGPRVAFGYKFEDSLDTVKTLLFEIIRVITFYP